MGGFKLVGSEMVIEQAGRTPFSTAGKLLMLLPGEETFNATLSFPDVAKTEIYGWSFTSQADPFSDAYGWGATGQSFVGAHPQEWSTTVVLGSVPAGANFHMGRASFIRTGLPSHSWWNYPLSVLVPENAGIQIAGSFLLEQAPGFCRAASIYINGGSLIAFLQQSVSAGAGNYDAWGHNDVPVSGAGAGGENSSSGGPSIPIYGSDASPYRKVGSGVSPTRFGARSNVNSHKLGGSNAAVFNDPTNYASTYSLTVKTRFGRLNS